MPCFVQNEVYFTLLWSIQYTSYMFYLRSGLTAEIKARATLEQLGVDFVLRNLMSLFLSYGDKGRNYSLTWEAKNVNLKTLETLRYAYILRMLKHNIT